MNFNFSEVAENTPIVSKQAKPGMALFTIKGVEFKTNSNDKAYFVVEFVNKENQTFKHQFYVSSPKAMARLKELSNNCKVTLGAAETPDLIIAKLVGKQVILIVDGDKEIANIDGKDVVVTRPTLRFVHFSFDVDSGVTLNNDNVIINDKTGGLVPSAAGTPTDSLSAPAPLNDLPF